MKPETITADEYRKRVNAPRLKPRKAVPTATELPPRPAVLERNVVPEFTLSVVGDLADLNSLMRKTVKDRMRQGAASKDLVKMEWWRDKPCVKGRYKVRMHLKVGSRKKDPSNLYTGALKSALDALQDVNAIDGDGWPHHVGPDQFSWEYVKGITCIMDLTITAVDKEF